MSKKIILVLFAILVLVCILCTTNTNFKMFTFAEQPQTTSRGNEKPNNFPFESNPSQLNFEFYSQFNDVKKRTDFNSLRKNISPKIQAATIGYTPTATNNPSNDWMKFVKTANGDLYYIDGVGDSVFFAQGSESGVSQTFFNRNGYTVVSAVTFPSDNKKMSVERNGLKQSLNNDFTITNSTTITFVLELEDETVKIITSSSIIN